MDTTESRYRILQPVAGKRDCYIWQEVAGLQRFAWGTYKRPLGYWRAFLDTARGDAYTSLLSHPTSNSRSL